MTGVLSKGKGLCAVELCSLLELAQPLFALVLMVLVLHLDVVLGKALGPVIGKELAVATVEDVHLGVIELGILEVIDSTITVAYKLGHARGAKLRVFTVKDKQGVGRGVGLEEFVGQLLLVVEVEGTFNVATVVFIFEAAVDNVDAIVMGVVVAV